MTLEPTLAELSTVTHQRSTHARRCLSRLSCDNRCTHYTLGYLLFVTRFKLLVAEAGIASKGRILPESGICKRPEPSEDQYVPEAEVGICKRPGPSDGQDLPEAGRN
ncbi:hypothetical protein J6590_042359 [Homalodisca vitripennis]|nr:hypothetical protein J6590_042359 [Homalodisca vitripennis]